MMTIPWCSSESSLFDVAAEYPRSKGDGYAYSDDFHLVRGRERRVIEACGVVGVHYGVKLPGE